MSPSEASSGNEKDLLRVALSEALPYAKILEVGPPKTGVRGISAKAVISIDGVPIKAFAKLNQRDEQCFQREAAAVLLLRFIDATGLNLAKPIVSSENPNLIVWHDLGEMECLGDLLEAEDRLAAESSLLALADALAVLHSSTRPHYADASVVLKDRSRLECSMLREGTDKIATLIERLRGNSGGTAQAVNGLVDLYEDQHRFAALAHGDQAPSNVLCKSGDIWLVDFEYASFRPALYDLATWSVLCPLPFEIVKEMIGRYRSAVSGWMPKCEFELSWGIACAFRALSMATWFCPGIIESKGHWGKDWDKRSALITALERAAEATRDIERLESVNRLLGMFFECADAAWVLSPLVWPAFSISKQK